MDTLIQPHILVLEPDPPIRALLTAVLRRMSLRITACEDEREAASHCLRRHRYSAILASTDMPGLDALLRELRPSPHAERPKIVLLTTSDARPRTTEADVVLLKPLDLSELHAAIATCCTVCGDDRARTPLSRAG